MIFTLEASLGAAFFIFLGVGGLDFTSFFSSTAGAAFISLSETTGCLSFLTAAFLGAGFLVSFLGTTISFSLEGTAYFSALLSISIFSIEGFTFFIIRDD